MIGQQSPLKVPGGAGRREQRWRAAAVCLVLAAITFAVFGQTLTHEFIDYDDNEYVYDNPVVARGLTLKGMVWAFTSIHADNWHPLTWLSHELDCQLYGLHPGGHHLTNVLLHTATVIALFLVLRQMTGALWRSAFVAAVFAIHPLRVESVAWVAERKDVLSGLFFMLTIGAYVRYARRPWSWGRYGLVLVLFALGLMCKPMLVTLPVGAVAAGLLAVATGGTPKAFGVGAGKAAFAGAFRRWLRRHAFGANRSHAIDRGHYSMLLRCVNALVTCKVYLGQMVWPAGLAVFYPFPRNGLSAWEAAWHGMLLAVLSAVAWGERRTRPWLLMGWVWYLVMLLPVAGVIQVGEQAHADRYTYLPQIGIYVAVTWLAAEWRLKPCGSWGPHGRRAGGVDGLRLETDHVLEKQRNPVDPRACLHHRQLHRPLQLRHRSSPKWKTGRRDHPLPGGIANRAPLRGNPQQPRHRSVQKGRVDEAITHFQKALQIKPNNAKAHNNLGKALLQKGRVDEAIAHFQRRCKSTLTMRKPTATSATLCCKREEWTKRSPIIKRHWQSTPAMLRPGATSNKPCSKSKERMKRLHINKTTAATGFRQRLLILSTNQR